MESDIDNNGSAGPNSPEAAAAECQFEKCQRQQRRNTDFSQADNDLKRFLSEREQNKRRESDGNVAVEPSVEQTFVR